MSQATLNIVSGGQEISKEMLIFNLDKKEGELKQALEIKRVVGLRTGGKRKYSFRMWPHPHDVLKAIQKGHQPRIIAGLTSCHDEPDRHPNVLLAFKKDYPVDGAAGDWWVPWMEVINTPRIPPKPATPMPKPKATPVAAAVPQPPQPRKREEELERPAKKRSLLSVINTHMAQK